MADLPDGFDRLKAELLWLHDLGLLPAQTMPSPSWTGCQRLADALAEHLESPHFLTFLSLAMLLWAVVYASWR